MQIIIVFTVHSLVLKVNDLRINLLNVDFNPQNVEVSVDASHDCVVETVQLLQECQLLADALQVVVVRQWQTEKFFSCTVRHKLAPELVKAAL